MATDRQILRDKLLKFFTEDQLYFSPPEKVRLTYPCLIYNKTGYEIDNANNTSYKEHTIFNVTYITRNPDDDKPLEMKRALKNCKILSHETIDNLYHTYLRIYI